MRKVKLTHGYAALVDNKDYQRVISVGTGTWWPVRNRTTVYAYTKIKGKDVPMHTFILGGKADHRDHNGLNNQRHNLRLATQSQNLMNMSKTTSKTSSRYKGVCWHKKAKKWVASIKLEQRSIYIGLFSTQIVAARAYDKKAKELFGEFANTNFKESL